MMAMDMAIRVVTCALLTLGITGCSAASIPVTEVLNHGHCSGLAAGVSEANLDDVARFRGRRMLGNAALPPDSEPVNASAPPRLIAISRGEQPTAGYSLELLSAQTVGEGDTRIRLRWRTPSAHDSVAQMITHPCMVVGLPEDATGKVLVELEDGTALGEIPARP